MFTTYQVTLQFVYLLPYHTQLYAHSFDLASLVIKHTSWFSLLFKIMHGFLHSWVLACPRQAYIFSWRIQHTNAAKAIVDICRAQSNNLDLFYFSQIVIERLDFTNKVSICLTSNCVINETENTLFKFMIIVARVCKKNMNTIYPSHLKRELIIKRGKNRRVYKI